MTNDFYRATTWAMIITLGLVWCLMAWGNWQERLNLSERIDADEYFIRKIEKNMENSILIDKELFDIIKDLEVWNEVLRTQLNQLGEEVLNK